MSVFVLFAPCMFVCTKKQTVSPDRQWIQNSVADGQFSKGCSVHDGERISLLCEGVWTQKTATLIALLLYTFAKQCCLLTGFGLFSPAELFIGHPLQLYFLGGFHQSFGQLHLWFGRLSNRAKWYFCWFRTLHLHWSRYTPFSAFLLIFLVWNRPMTSSSHISRRNPFALDPNVFSCVSVLHFIVVWTMRANLTRFQYAHVACEVLFPSFVYAWPFYWIVCSLYWSQEPFSGNSMAICLKFTLFLKLCTTV